jgi:heat shock protein HtpX
MRSVQGLSNLNLKIMLTSILVFGVVSGIIGLLMWYSGIRGASSIYLWMFVSFAMIIGQWYFGPNLIKWVTKARELRENELPELHQMVSKYANIAGIPKPKLFIVNEPSPNAFAFGRTQGSSNIAVHTGLLEILNKEELEGVIAHEVGHIKHRDVILMTLASAVPIVLYYAVILFSSRDERSPLGGIGVFIGAIFAQFLGQILVMWLSRSREYYADAFSAYSTNNPSALMSGLAKISYQMMRVKPAAAGKTMASFYISDPSGEGKQSIHEIAAAIASGNEAELVSAIEKEKGMGKMEFLMTHPLTGKRLEALLKIKKQIGA